MLVIGLTGGIGSGKSTVAGLFTKLGVTVIDADQLAKDVTQQGKPVLQQISEKFGTFVLNNDGSLDRAALRRVIFADADKRRWLENLLHPLIRNELRQQIETALSPYCIAVIPLLFETDPNPLINRILVVDSSEQLQIQRTCLRDKLSVEEISAILQAQTHRHRRLASADDIIINNNDGMEELIPQVEKLHQFYLELSQHVLPKSGDLSPSQ